MGQGGEERLGLEGQRFGTFDDFKDVGVERIDLGESFQVFGDLTLSVCFLMKLELLRIAILHKPDLLLSHLFEI
jgi:hypothetical protein